MGGERLGEGGDDPARVRGGDGKLVARVTGGDLRDPRIAVAAVDHPAEHGVDELGWPLARDLPGERDGLAHSGVLGHAHRQDLMRAESEQVEHPTVEFVEWAIHAAGKHFVVEPAPAQRAVGQLGGEARIARIQSRVSQDRRPHEIGVGIVRGNGMEQVVGRTARPPRRSTRAPRSCRALRPRVSPA